MKKLNFNDYFTKSSKCPDDWEDFAWVMKEFTTENKEGDESSVTVTSYEKGQRGSALFGPVCIKDCIVVNYEFNNVGTRQIFEADELVEAMDFAMKCIAFIKA